MPNLCSYDVNEIILLFRQKKRKVTMTCTTSRKRKLEKRPRKLMMRRWLRATISPPSTHRNGPKLFDRTSLATSAHILVTDGNYYYNTTNMTIIHYSDGLLDLIKFTKIAVFLLIIQQFYM